MYKCQKLNKIISAWVIVPVHKSTLLYIMLRCIQVHFVRNSNNKLPHYFWATLYKYMYTHKYMCAYIKVYTFKSDIYNLDLCLMKRNLKIKRLWIWQKSTVQVIFAQCLTLLHLATRKKIYQESEWIYMVHIPFSQNMKW